MDSHHFAVSNALKKRTTFHWSVAQCYKVCYPWGFADDDATNCVVRIMANGDQTRRLHTQKSQWFKSYLAMTNLKMWSSVSRSLRNHTLAFWGMAFWVSGLWTTWDVEWSQTSKLRESFRGKVGYSPKKNTLPLTSWVNLTLSAFFTRKLRCFTWKCAVNKGETFTNHPIFLGFHVSFRICTVIGRGPQPNIFIPKGDCSWWILR